jgi:two-component system, response regulator PdtaR
VQDRRLWGYLLGTDDKSGLDEGASALKGVRLLVVEDSWQVASTMKSALEEAGMMVAKPAATLAAAKRLMANHIFDLAVVDINLKGEMSYDLIVRLHDRGVRVVVVSGYVTPDESIPNAAAVLQKPVSTVELIATLRRVMHAA